MKKDSKKPQLRRGRKSSQQMASWRCIKHWTYVAVMLVLMCSGERLLS
jgi:hypothetical protein